VSRTRLSLDEQIVDAAVTGRARVLSKLLDQNPGKLRMIGGRWNTPLLHLAAQHGRASCVDVLLKKGFPVNLRDKLDNAPALYWAASSGSVAVLRKLLKAGADLHAEGDDHGVGLIGWAVFFSKPRLEAARFLMNRGAQPNIFTAVALNRADIVRKIVKATPGSLSARLTATEHARTALHVAVARNLPKMAKLLVELGADVAARDSEGKTPLNLARPRTHKSIARTLIAAGANPKDLALDAFDTVVPILNVKNVPVSTRYYVRKLGFKKNWDWGEPPTFASVGRGKVEIFLCEGEQGQTGTWMWVGMQDTDALYKEYKKSGAIIARRPKNYPWGSREMLVKDLDGHVLRMASEATGPADED
jgi:Ankyrin repeats (3 copies)/Glyoxalase/Bleomycin resistance protein/Dioxygenase superfamily/Ankyrin repeats (many copies)